MDGLHVYDEQGCIVQMNAAARELLARTGILELMAPPIQDHLARATTILAEGGRLPAEQLPISRILRGERFPAEQAVALRVPTRDGEELAITVTGGPLCEAQGQIMGAVLLARDVTEEQRAQSQREEQAQQLRLQARLIALAHDAILVCDPHYRILSWNRGAERLYGWTAQQAQGQVTHTLLQTRFLLSQAAVARRLHQQGQWEGELVQTCRDGRLVVVESRQVLLRNLHGRPSAILEINRDISERRRLELLEREVHAQMGDHLSLLQTVLDELPLCGLPRPRQRGATRAGQPCPGGRL